MAKKGYCQPSDVSGFLGLSFTPAQENQADKLIESTETLIDAWTSRGWLVGEQESEAHYLGEYWRTRIIYLRYAPVEVVTEVRTADDVVLVEGENYEIKSLEEGTIGLKATIHQVLYVQYTPVNAVPSPIRDACAEWVAARMQPALRPDSYGLDSYSLPDLTVKFSRQMMNGMPDTVQQALDLFRYPVTA